MNILIIEPSRLFQLTLEKIFIPYATTLHITESGRKARQLFKDYPIDLICLSLYLQDMDGNDFISEIRKEQWGETIPILMMTSKKDQDVISRTFRRGATELFSKENPLALEKYLQTFAEHARQQAQLSGDILLIDNDKKQVEAILDYFADTRLRFVHFTTAEQAADMARAAEFDLVITNVVLSGSMTGMALIRDIREISEAMYRVPVLAITEAANFTQKLELLRAGANDSIQKPIMLEELSIRVKNLLQNKKLFDTVEMQKLQLEELAIRDQLTGLYNRHYLLNMADGAINEALRYRFPVALLVLDLDFFKKINDTYGHNVGDKVLKATADLFMETFRGSDTPVRYGGEEFVVLLPHCTLEDAYFRAESLRRDMMVLFPEGLRVTASIGVAQADMTKKITFVELFRAADKALYEAKRDGRNCVRKAQVA